MPRELILREGDHEYSVTASEGRVSVDGGEPIAAAQAPGGLVLIGEGARRTAWVAVTGDVRWVFFDGRAHAFDTIRPGARRRSGGHHGTLSAPMPATVLKVQAAAGDRVSRGDVLIVLEAMKMELPVRAPFDGTVSAVNCRPGELVQPGVGLIEIEEISS